MSINVTTTRDRFVRLPTYNSPATGQDPRPTVLTLFGTRPEAIKLAPVIKNLERQSEFVKTLNVSSGQHTDLLHPFVQRLGIRIDQDLAVMRANQAPSEVCARVLASFDGILSAVSPSIVLVQGDTTTAMAGALAAFHRGILVGHVEAGLRSGNILSPFPEEMNRRLISRLATFHFAATACNRDTLVDEGIDPANIFVTGNPVVDSLREILSTPPSDRVDSLIAATRGLKRIVLTTHRRESFGTAMDANLKVLRRFVTEHEDVALIFPVHPNPTVINAAREALSDHSRIHLIEPLSYEDFVSLLNSSWLIVSDSGGVQEEAPTLGKPLLVLRENTERPEAIECGVARLVGGDPDVLSEMLDDVYKDGVSLDAVMKARNPFGDGDSGERIAEIVIALLTEATERIPVVAAV